VLLEVTHRGECPVITTPDEAAAAIAPYPEFGYRVLLDTYHLIRQGLDVAGAIAAAADLRGSIHLSDDNRRLPGLGRMDFAPVLGALASRGYAGSLVLEGTFGGDPREDVRASAAYLRRVGVR
jgi:sugar phosphate isomerase/epimerase